MRPVVSFLIRSAGRLAFAGTLAVAGLLSQTHTADAATIPVVDLPPAQLVAQNGAYLTQTGCEEIFPAFSNVIDTAGGKPYHMVPADEPGRHFLCSPTVASTLDVRAGQVAGILSNDAFAQQAGSGSAAGATQQLQQQVNQNAPESSCGYFCRKALNVFIYLIQLWLRWVASFWIWVLGLSAKLLADAVSIGDFITHEFVTTGWPFVQGLVNLGFIIVLLFIAFATTLRLDTGMGGVTKLLPKLLIAAVLINFSLIIAGGLIDLSRVLMAIETRALTNGSTANLGANIVAKSNLVNTVFKVTSGQGFLVQEASAAQQASANVSLGQTWSIVAEQILAVIVIAGLAIAMFTITVAFYIRHIILLLLLILSPIPYLAFVLPQTKSAASKWWSTFLRWVLYGPAALFFLILIVSLGNNPTDYVAGDNGVYDSLVRTAIVMMLLFAAATSARFIGAAGAGLALSFAAGATKRGARFGLATTGLPAAAYVGRKLGGAAGNQARDFGGAYTKGLKARAKAGELFGGGRLGKGVKAMMPAERGADGKLKDGQKSWGSTLGGRAAPLTKKAQALKAVTTNPALAADNKLVSKKQGNLEKFKDDAYFKSTYAKDYARDPAGTLAKMKADPIAQMDMTKHDVVDAIEADVRLRTAVAGMDKTSFLEGSVTSTMDKQDVDVAFRYGDETIRNNLMTNLNVVRAMDDGLKSDIMAGKFGDEMQKKLERKLTEIDRKDRGQ